MTPSIRTCEITVFEVVHSTYEKMPWVYDKSFGYCTLALIPINVLNMKTAFYFLHNDVLPAFGPSYMSESEIWAV